MGLGYPLRMGRPVDVTPTQPTFAALRLAGAAIQRRTAPARLAKTTIPRGVSRVDSFLCVKIHIQFPGNGDIGNITVTDGVRSDGQCGPGLPLEDGSPSQCDPDSADFCCSAWGYCGGSEEHCNCDTCANYKSSGGEWSRLYSTTLI